MINDLKNLLLGQYTIWKRQLQKKKTAGLNNSIVFKTYNFSPQMEKKLFRKMVFILVWIEFLPSHISVCALQRQRCKGNFCLSNKEKAIWVFSLLQFYLVSMTLKPSSIFPYQAEGFGDRH